jgi:hypothetical protein
MRVPAPAGGRPPRTDSRCAPPTASARAPPVPNQVAEVLKSDLPRHPFLIRSFPILSVHSRNRLLFPVIFCYFLFSSVIVCFFHLFLFILLFFCYLLLSSVIFCHFRHLQDSLRHFLIISISVYIPIPVPVDIPSLLPHPSAPFRDPV